MDKIKTAMLVLQVIMLLGQTVLLLRANKHYEKINRDLKELERINKKSI